MRGHVRKRGNKWAVVVDLGRDGSGRRRQRWHSGFATKKAAEAGLAEILTRLDKGSYVTATKQSYGEFLIDEWLPAIKSTVRPSTYSMYRYLVVTHVEPALGQTRLVRLTPQMLNALYGTLLTSGRASGKGGLSPRTVRLVHTTIHRSLGDAVRWDKLPRNPADLADPPRATKREMQVWTPEQIRAFLGHVEQDRLFALWRLAVTTGMRRGELLGLRWSDIDFGAKRLSVRQNLISVGYRVMVSEPKTARGRRTIALDEATLKALNRHRAAQSHELCEIGAGSPRSDLVFAVEDGTAMHPEKVSKMFEDLATSAGLPRIRFHDLRHSAATAALAAGQPAKVVADRLGHSSIAITLDTYSHVLPSLDEQAAAAVADIIDSAVG